MKNLIIIIALGVGGYFAYQYFTGSSQQDSTSSAPTFNMYSLPEVCQEQGENLKNAFQRHKSGEIKKSTLNGYTSQFRRCLKSRAGFTDSQIEEAYNGIKNSR